MNFSWDKILSPGEIVRKEFAISKRFSIMVLTISVLAAIVVALSSLFAGFGIFLLGFLYYLYLRVAKHYAFTSKRIILVDSFLGTNVTSIDYDQITDVEIVVSFAEQIAGWGTFTINTAGTHSPKISLSFIDNPQALKQSLDEIRDQK